MSSVSQVAMPDEPVHLKSSEEINMDDVDILAYVSRCQPGPVDEVEVEVTKCACVFKSRSRLTNVMRLLAIYFHEVLVLYNHLYLQIAS